MPPFARRPQRPRRLSTTLGLRAGPSAFSTPFTEAALPSTPPIGRPVSAASSFRDAFLRRPVQFQQQALLNAFSPESGMSRAEGAAEGLGKNQSRAEVGTPGGGMSRAEGGAGGLGRDTFRAEGAAEGLGRGKSRAAANARDRRRRGQADAPTAV
ncbi:hypothetical protein LCGC14_0289380 [marine sediment metagenome]|uniref:Uncharacterized protein n=1 Tax=marine sediment metagenome TaxID=412755 RepID=A0A0F9WF17_9ZZZZ